jgi:ATP-dependent helicase/nuclease subunit B
MEKRDFGERVHRILAAFHGGDPLLPGPFQETLTEDTVSAAHELMTRIADAVFSPDIGRDYLARGWLLRWRSIADSYLQEQRAWQRKWIPDLTETSITRALAPPCGLELHGRVDRVDRSDGERCVIDYKTGAVPRDDAVLGGEHVQLPFYALLLEDVTAVAFLLLEPGKARRTAAIGASGLAALVDATRERLCDTQRMLLDGAQLPAWGDNAVCARCDARGVCRRELWATDEGSAA